MAFATKYKFTLYLFEMLNMFKFDIVFLLLALRLHGDEDAFDEEEEALQELIPKHSH